MFRVTPSTEVFTTGETVHFTLAVSGVSITDIRWSFAYSQGFGLSLPACDGQLTCDAAPTASGSMRVSARVSGTSQGVSTFTAELTAQPPCPPTGDPILDNSRALRDSLNSEFLQSVAADREYNGYILRNKTTGVYSLKRLDVSGNDRCSSWNPVDPPTFPNDTIVAGYHTHVVPDGTKFGPNCRRKDPNEVAGVGPSEEDITNTRNILKRPDYIIDFLEMHRVNADGTFQSWPWTHVNGCRRG